MKTSLFLSLCFTVSCIAARAQYFNIYPTLVTADSNGYRYQVSGVQAFTDSLPMVLNAELLSNDEQLDLIAGTLYDLSDTATFTGLTVDASTGTFTIDLGSHASDNYILHMWVGIAGTRYDEIYYQQP
jgi:hypothetical protein